MNWFDALIMGIVQGLSEYLPISSSGHLEIFRSILGIDLEGAEALELVVALHVATVLSTIVVLWKEFLPLCTSFLTLKRDNNTLYVLKIFVSCIPIAIVGLLLQRPDRQPLRRLTDARRRMPDLHRASTLFRLLLPRTETIGRLLRFSRHSAHAA